jgi:hypothetical protein
MVTSTLRSLMPGQAPPAADLQALAQVVSRQLAAHRAGLPLVAPRRDIAMNYRVWGLKFGSQTDQVLQSPGAIADLFQRDGIDGRLLILGEAGVGKTHTLLAVGELLVKRKGPVPVLVDSSGWAGETLREWLIKTLWQDYRVAKGAASLWVDTAQLTLMIDGFDHLATPQKRKFAAALEALLQTNPNQTALLCCRRQVLESSGLTFDQFNSGVNIIPLGAQQVKDYVLAQDRPDLWPVIKGSKVLQQLARLPLCLTMLVAFPHLAEPPVRSQADLMQRYVDDRLGQAKGNPALHRGALTWLAAQLGQRPRLFYLDDLRFAWLPESRQLLYRLLLGLTLALVMGLVGGNLPLGLALGLVMSQVDLEGFPYLRLGLAIASPSRLLFLLATAAGLSLGLGLGLGAAAALLLSPFGDGGVAFGYGGAIGAGIGWGLALVGLLGTGLLGSPQGRQTPNQDTYLALRNTTLLVLVLAIVMTLLLAFPSMAAGQPAMTLLPLGRSRLLAAGLISALLWLSFSLQHAIVRLLLAGRQGLPLGARPWLDTMVDTGLLRRLGGGYSFGHEILRQTLAGGQQPGTR